MSHVHESIYICIYGLYKDKSFDKSDVAVVVPIPPGPSFKY